jgi:signal recognition particle subunit SEC65
MRRRGLMVLWPQYFDKNRSVRLGRRVPLKEATSGPALQDLITAAKDLKYEFEIDTNAKYPATWWDDPGLIMIDNSGQKKTFVLHRFAMAVQKSQKKRHDDAKLEEVRKKYKKKNEMKAKLKDKLRGKAEN